MGPKGSLSIGVERYEFPKIANDYWDSNWLIITGHAVLNGKSWSFRDPCLTTFEVQRLADWLDEVSSGNSEKKFCSFTEPNLDFALVHDVALRIAFSHEALPPWSNQPRDCGEIGFEIPIDDRLVAAASTLRTLLMRFPIRARNGN
ncbi:MAG: hypothetical protein AAFQ27_14615 [Pseudomonadota bacterium]